jgi:hypothetical protein
MIVVRGGLVSTATGRDLPNVNTAIYTMTSGRRPRSCGITRTPSSTRLTSRTTATSLSRPSSAETSQATTGNPYAACASSGEAYLLSEPARQWYRIS